MLFFFYLLHDSFLIVVTQRSAEFVIIHRWTILLDAPAASDLCRNGQNKSSTVSLKRGQLQHKCWTNLIISMFVITVMKARPARADWTRNVFIRSLSDTQQRRQQMLQHLSTRPPTIRPRCPNTALLIASPLEFFHSATISFP